MLNTVTMTAGQRLEFHEPGDFFRVLSATDVLTVEFYANGKEIAEAVGVGAGYAEKFDLGEFDRIAITSTSAQTIQFVTRLGNVVNYDAPPTGNVTVSNTGGSFVQMQQTVPSIVATISNAKSRRYFMVQNKSATGTIWVYLGFGATTNNGVRLGPGDSLEYAGYAPDNEITAIGDIASNPDVVIVEASV